MGRVHSKHSPQHTRLSRLLDLSSSVATRSHLRLCLVLCRRYRRYNPGAVGTSLCQIGWAICNAGRLAPVTRARSPICDSLLFFRVISGISVNRSTRFDRCAWKTPLFHRCLCHTLFSPRCVQGASHLCAGLRHCFFVLLGMRAGVRRTASRFDWWGHPVALFGCGDVARSDVTKAKE